MGKRSGSALFRVRNRKSFKLLVRIIAMEGINVKDKAPLDNGQAQLAPNIKAPSPGRSRSRQNLMLL
jgi:hypothetical protein